MLLQILAGAVGLAVDRAVPAAEPALARGHVVVLLHGRAVLVQSQDAALGAGGV